MTLYFYDLMVSFLLTAFCSLQTAEKVCTLFRPYKDRDIFFSRQTNIAPERGCTMTHKLEKNKLSFKCIFPQVFSFLLTYQVKQSFTHNLPLLTHSLGILCKPTSFTLLSKPLFILNRSGLFLPVVYLVTPLLHLNLSNHFFALPNEMAEKLANESNPIPPIQPLQIIDKPTEERQRSLVSWSVTSSNVKGVF